jgi:anaerobic magnesium-protoporphyrin IX monomethyl ester cyclase
VPAAKAVLERLGEHHAAHLDLAGAYYRAGELDLAEHHARRALELGYPAPGLVHNYFGCIAYARGDVQAMMDHFMTAAKVDPQHHVLLKNVEAARTWFREKGPERELPLELRADHDFRLLERTTQPTLPGPLPSDFSDFDTPSLIQPAPFEPSLVMQEGHERIAFPMNRPSKRLKVLRD